MEDKELVEGLAHRLRRFASRVCRKNGTNLQSLDLQWYRDEAKNLIPVLKKMKG